MNLRKSHIFLIMLIVCFAAFYFGVYRSVKHDKVIMKPADVLRISMYTMPEELNIYRFEDINVYKILKPVHMGLLSYDYKGNIFSGVARTWKSSASGMKYTFEIDSSLKFHNGEKVSCKDVKYSFDSLFENKFNNPIKTIVKSYNCLSINKFEIILKRKSNLFLDSLANLGASIIPYGSNTSRNVLIGIGPYQLQSIQNNSVYLKRLSEHPLLNSWSARNIEFRHYATISNAVEDFYMGHVDIVDLKGKSDPVGNEKDFKATSYFYNKTHFVQVSHFLRKQYPQLVKCINHTINREALVSYIDPNKKIFAPAYGVIAPFMGGYYNGEIDQRKLNVECSLGSKKYKILVIKELYIEKMLLYLKETLEKLNAEIEVEEVSKSEFIRRVYSDEYEITLSAFGLDVVAARMLWFFYGQNSVMPVLLEPDSKMEDLNKIENESNQTMLDGLIYSFEKEMFEESHFIPLVFQRNEYLINKCINVENFTQITSVETVQEIGKIPGCVQ